MKAYDLQEGRFVLDHCPNCGVAHLFPQALYDTAQHRKPNVSIYCPNGHNWHYTGERAEDKLRRERDRLIQQQAQLTDEIAEQKRRADIAEARERRLKKRAAAGTCPCCKRSFSNMATHMKQKHPDFVSDNIVKLKA